MNLNLVEYYDVLFKSARINIRGVIALPDFGCLLFDLA